MESVIISSEKVRPSSPTPQNLRNYRFSMLDQTVPSMLISFILFFPNTTKISDLDSFISQTTQQLKRSLSLILTRFYPLAGRVNGDGESIDCNDEGMPLVVAKFTGHKLSDLLRNPDQKLLRRLLSCEITLDAEYGPDSTVAVIQVNYFDCGGIAIGAVFAHKLADATTMATFLNSWGNATRGSKQAVCPNYFLQSMFPYRGELQMQFGSAENVLKTGKPAMRRYVFDASAISSLRSKSEGATRVEAVSAIIWKCFMAASLAHNVSASAFTQAVNLRRRAQPPFPSDCFGNFLGFATVTGGNEHEHERERELGMLVRKMRDAVSKIDGEYVDRLRGDEGLSGYHRNFRLMLSDVPRGAEFLCVSSWCSLGLYNMDFGWGKPIWIARCDVLKDPNSPFCNFVWLMDTRTGDGVEAWVILDEEFMAVFDDDEELRALASVDPSPLDIGATI